MRLFELAPIYVAILSVTALPLDLRQCRAAEPVEAGLPEGFVEEGPLPEGFPPPGETGVVVEKTYPAARSFSATGADAFMRCFQYLTSNDHKMTAPVVVEYDEDALEPEAGERSISLPIPFERMHFLLETPSIDRPRDVGNVRVADMPAVRVLSYAFQGQLSSESIARAQHAITEHLAGMEQAEATGRFRLLGYNSPMIAREKTYWEVQLPIRDPDEGGPSPGG